jgi:hypothetical protein
MAQNEVLTRITTFLMLVSASIVSLALVEQVTRFDRTFITFALVLLGLLVVVGTLTQMRVGNQSIEDLAHVIGMNRLRAAYVELDPDIERYLVTSPPRRRRRPVADLQPPLLDRIAPRRVPAPAPTPAAGGYPERADLGLCGSSAVPSGPANRGLGVPSARSDGRSPGSLAAADGRMRYPLVVVPTDVVHTRATGGRPPNAVWGRAEL